jgi:hypothetical protein
VPIDVASALRIKGTIDAALAASRDDSPAAGVALIDAYGRIRAVCVDLVAGTEAETEFDRLYPIIEPLNEATVDRAYSRTLAGARVAAAGGRARVLLAQLAGWLGSWPNAEQLLDELIAALEQAEAEATEPAEKERLASLLEGLKGAGRQIAVGVVTAYLTRVHV